MWNPVVLLRQACFAVLGLLSCLVAAPYAQAQTPSVAVHGGGRSGTVCSQSHYIAPSDLAGVRGAYELSNGDVLQVSRESRRYFAEMGKTGRMEIIPLNDNTFVEKGGPVRLSFERDWPWVDVAVSGLDAPRPAGAACPPG